MAQITQPVTFNVFGRSNRQPGTYFSATAQIPDGIYAVGISDTMSDADASDPANSFRLVVRVSRDGVDWVSAGNSAVLFIIAPWAGGTHIDKRTGLVVPNHLGMAWSDTALANGAYTGWFVRGELDQPVRLAVGFTVTAYPPGFDPQN